jgi:hypothetical protein
MKGLHKYLDIPRFTDICVDRLLCTYKNSEVEISVVMVTHNIMPSIVLTGKLMHTFLGLPSGGSYSSVFFFLNADIAVNLPFIVEQLFPDDPPHLSTVLFLNILRFFFCIVPVLT